MVPWVDVTVRVLMLIGLGATWLGTIVPIFPAPTLMWVLILLYGLVTGFDLKGGIIFAVITLLTIGSLLVDNIFSIAGARKGGARWWSVVIAGAVGLVSSLFVTPIGGILLTIAALFLAEYYFRRDANLAWDATKQMVVGWGWATVARLIIGAVVIGAWLIWAFT